MSEEEKKTPAPEEPQPEQPQKSDSSVPSETAVKVSCALAYLYILFFLPLIVCPNSKFGKFHANQGLVLLLTAAALQIVFMILNLFLPGIIYAILSAIESVALLLATVYGIVNACTDKMNKLPLIGEITILK